jgi:hypothetical protein
MADFNYDMFSLGTRAKEKLKEVSQEGATSAGIGAKPADEQEPMDKGFYENMYEAILSYFDNAEEADRVLTAKEIDKDRTKEEVLREFDALDKLMVEDTETPSLDYFDEIDVDTREEMTDAQAKNLREVAKTEFGQPLGGGLKDVTDTEEGKLTNEEPLYELAEDIDPGTIETKGLMSKPGGDSADGVQPTDGKDPTQDLLDRIAFGEGADPVKLKAQEKHGIGTTQYDMVYNYGDTLAPSKPVSEMTMEELYDFQTDLINATKGTVPGTSLGTSAVGKYQVIRKSLFGSGTADKPAKNSWADKLNLKADTVYTPEIQEKIAMLALKEAGYESFIRGDKTEKAFHDRIANIWASVAKASGKDTYGQGIHTVKADLDPMYELLKPVKTENTNRETSLRPMLRPEEEDS